MSKEDLVSIIMPLYNASNYIGNTIKCIQAQTYCNWELIVVDDLSTDNSAELVSKFASQDSRIKLFKQNKNQGAAMARNRAVKESNGKFLAFLDSDDIWVPDKLTRQINFMKTNNQSFTCSYYGKIDEDGNNLHYTVKAKRIVTYNRLLLHNIGNSTVIYNKEVLGKTYIPNIRKRNDYLMWLTVIKKAQRIICIPEVLTFHRLRAESLSSKKMSLFKYHWLIYRKYEKLSLLKSISVLGIISFNSLRAKIFLFSR